MGTRSLNGESRSRFVGSSPPLFRGPLIFLRLLLFLRLLIFAALYAGEKRRMAWNRYVGTKMSLGRTPGSTVKIEPVGLSTRGSVERRIVTVIGSWLRLPEQKGLGLTAPVKRSAARERSRPIGRTELASDCKTLHPPRPSGRSPHRPLIFLWQRFLWGSNYKSKVQSLTLE